MLDLFIPVGTIPIDDPSGQGSLFFGRQFHDGVLNLGEIHGTIVPHSVTGNP